MNIHAFSKIILITLLLFFAIASFVTGGVTLFQGFSDPTYTINTQTASSDLDSKLRFLSGVWLTLGLAILWSIVHLKKSFVLINFSAIGIIFGGLARMISLTSTNFSSSKFILIALIETIGGSLIILFSYMVQKNYQKKD